MLPDRVIEGDLRVMGSPAHEPAAHRIRLVRRVYPADEFAEVCLVHSAPELATDHDVVLPAAAMSAPYDTVVQTDLRGVVWTFQFGKRVGHLSEIETVRTAAKNSELERPTALGMGRDRGWMGCQHRLEAIWGTSRVHRILPQRHALHFAACVQ